jgi:hypothetical protein
MMKNIMYGAIILAALAFAYRQGHSSYNTPGTQSENTADNISKEELARKVANEQKKRKEAERKLEEAKLQEQERIIYAKIVAIEKKIENDNQRLIRRIPRDSVLKYGTMISDYNKELRELNEKIKALGQQ